MLHSFRRLGAQLKSASTPLKFEVLEEREVPANFSVVDVAGLIAAITAANTNAQADTIDLQAGTTFNLTVVNNATNGNNGLPVILADGGNNLTIHGNGATITRDAAAPNFRILQVNNGAANLSIDHVTISNGNVAGNGGGILVQGGNLDLSDSTLAGNTSTGRGGGLDVEPTAVVNVLRSTISGNTSGNKGGGASFYKANGSITASTISGNKVGPTGTAGRGGGLFLYQGTQTISESTISGNAANRGGGAMLYKTVGTVIENTTIDGNNANSRGGGLFLYKGTETIRNTTISGNNAVINAGGVYFYKTAATVQSTIVAGNTKAGATPDDIVRDLGTVVADHNLIQTAPAVGTITTDNGGNLFGVDPLLAPLADNGGPTKTRALATGSPAIDVGANPAALTTDQRGGLYVRTFGGGTDIGAFEVQPPPVVPPTQQPICAPGDSDNTCFVKRLYVDLLGRRVDNDEAGLKYIAELDAGRSRRSVADEIVHSSEYAARQIRALYQSVLGRDADETGLASYVADVTSGRFKLEQVQADLIASDEFRNAHPGDQLIPAILAAIPGGTPESDSDPLAGQDQARDFALDVLASNGAIDANLATTYDTLLHRGLDDKAFDYRTLARNSSISSVLVEVAASDEYFNEHDETTLL